MTAFKWREAPEIFPFPTQNCAKKLQMARNAEIELKFTTKRENREEIHKKQGKYL